MNWCIPVLTGLMFLGSLVVLAVDHVDWAAVTSV